MTTGDCSASFDARLEAVAGHVAAQRVMLSAIAGQVGREAREIEVLKRLRDGQGDAGQSGQEKRRNQGVT